MLALIPTAKELREELQAAMKKWRKENPEPRIEIEEQPELPKPSVIRIDKQLLIIEVVSGDLLQLHIVEGNTSRKIELNYKQLGGLLGALNAVRTPMKNHKNWKTFYEEELNRHEYENAAWQRQMMAFKEAVKRRLGFSDCEQS